MLVSDFLDLAIIQDVDIRCHWILLLLWHIVYEFDWRLSINGLHVSRLNFQFPQFGL